MSFYFDWSSMFIRETGNMLQPKIDDLNNWGALYTFPEDLLASVSRVMKIVPKHNAAFKSGDTIYAVSPYDCVQRCFTDTIDIRLLASMGLLRHDRKEAHKLMNLMYEEAIREQNTNSSKA